MNILLLIKLDIHVTILRIKGSYFIVYVDRSSQPSREIVIFCKVFFIYFYSFLENLF
jgi:hypothetical protein